MYCRFRARLRKGGYEDVYHYIDRDPPKRQDNCCKMSRSRGFVTFSLAHGRYEKKIFRKQRTQDFLNHLMLLIRRKLYIRYMYFD